MSGTNLALNGTGRLGVELQLTSQPVEGLTLDADVTWVDARFSESGSLVPLAPWLTAGLLGTYTHASGVRAGLHLLVIAPRTLPHGATGAARASLDVTLGWHWRWLRLDLEVENVLAQDLREGEYHFASDWTPESGGASRLPVLHTVPGAPINARLTLGANF